MAVFRRRLNRFIITWQHFTKDSTGKGSNPWFRRRRRRVLAKTRVQHITKADPHTFLWKQT